MVRFHVRLNKKTNECDGCAAPVDSALSVGMGDAVPCMSGDRWDNVLGAGFVGYNNSLRPKRRYRVKRKKRN